MSQMQSSLSSMVPRYTLDERQRHTAEEKPRQTGLSATSDLPLSRHHSKSPLSSPMAQPEPGYIIPPADCPEPCTPTPVLEKSSTPRCDSLHPKHLSSTAKSSFPLLSTVTLTSMTKKESEDKQIQWQHAAYLAKHYPPDQGWPASYQDSGSELDCTAEKKQTMACFFCREKKIACQRPPIDNPDQTCK
jgi:hypothetical protein